MRRPSAGQGCFPWGTGVRSVERSCMTCGNTFAVTAGRRGRPPEFCSPGCRAAHTATRQDEWQRNNAAGTDRRAAVRCLVCGREFEAPAVSAGRLPRFCSDTCRRQRKTERNRTWRKQAGLAKAKSK